MNSDTLGSKNETTNYSWKLGYFLFTIVLLLITGYAYVGAANTGLLQLAAGISFFVIFLALPFQISFFADMLTSSGRSLSEIDTVTVEDSPIEAFNDPKIRLIASAIIAGFILVRMLGVGAWVAAPEITIFQSAIANNALSGILGLFENHGFFYFLFPTAYAVAVKRFDVDPVVAAVVMGLLIASIFTGYHLWRYKYQEGAQFSVFMFGIINVAGVYVFRAAFFGDILHFFNNYFVSSGLATTSQILFRLI